MPLEIRELVIKVAVGQQEGSQQAQTSNGNNADAKEAEINMIVEKILTILKEKSER